MSYFNSTSLPSTSSKFCLGDGYWAALGTNPDSDQPIKTNEWIDRLAPKALARPPIPSPSRALTVLLVDDDELIQSAVQGILEALGHTAITASGGEQALAMIEAGLQPEVVILDMNMPGLDGAATLPRLRELRPALPILLATGRVDQTATSLVEAHSGVLLLSKPFGFDDLQQKLEHLGAKVRVKS